jgi:hypothetical protein
VKLLYDILIASLTVFGVVGTFVYSYKIARSRVFVVGLVHELDNVEKSASLNSNVPAEIEEKAILGTPAAVFFATEVERRTRKDARLQALRHAMAQAEGAKKGRLLAEWNALFKIVQAEKLEEVAGELVAGEFVPESELQKKGTSSKKKWQCTKCGLVEGVEELRGEFRCSNCGNVVDCVGSEARTRSDKAALVESKEVELQKGLSEHAEVLDEHSNIFRAFERRLRRLELESVHRVQDLPDERAFSGREEFVN